MSGPLSGYRVLDFTQWQQGAHATAMLADMGAEVIKVEPRLTGEPARGWGMRQDFNAFFQAHNRNKKSITLDLKKPQGKGIIHKLVGKVDVLAENFRRGVMDRLGLGYQALSQINPRLIYAIASGFGPKGPKSDWPAFDLIGQATGGIMIANGEPGGEPRQVMGTPVADQVGAMVFAYGIVLALLARERTGIGQQLDVSLLGTQIALQPAAYCRRLQVEQPAPPAVRRRGSTYNYYKTGDDNKWIAISALEERRWPAFCQALGMATLKDDPRFASPAERGEHWQELLAMVQNAFLSKTREEWMEILHAHDIPCGPVHDYNEVAADPQVVANEYLVTVDHPTHGPIQMAGIPVQLSKTPGKAASPAPELGQHTEGILSEVGYTAEEIAELREQEVI